MACSSAAPLPRSTRHDETHVDFGVDEGKRLECNVDALVRADRAEVRRSRSGCPWRQRSSATALSEGGSANSDASKRGWNASSTGTDSRPRAASSSRWWGACVTIRSAWRSVERVTCRTPGAGSCGSTLWQITTRAVPLGARRRKYRYGGDITGWSHGRIIASAPNPLHALDGPAPRPRVVPIEHEGDRRKRSARARGILALPTMKQWRIHPSPADHIDRARRRHPSDHGAVELRDAGGERVDGADHGLPKTRHARRVLPRPGRRRPLERERITRFERQLGEAPVVLHAPRVVQHLLEESVARRDPVRDQTGHEQAHRRARTSGGRRGGLAGAAHPTGSRRRTSPSAPPTAPSS